MGLREEENLGITLSDLEIIASNVLKTKTERPDIFYKHCIGDGKVYKGDYEIEILDIYNDKIYFREFFCLVHNRLFPIEGTYKYMKAITMDNLLSEIEIGGLKKANRSFTKVIPDMLDY
mgnify:CR=1 FL=1